MRRLAFAFLALIPFTGYAQTTILRSARVFDGETIHKGWAIRVKSKSIEAAGPAASVDAPGAKIVDLPNVTLMPGLVAHEGLALRAARAVNHLRATLMAGFTTIRDLGTEGAQYTGVELKQAVNQGIIPGPRMLVSTRAIVATGSYQPKGFALEWHIPQGAAEAGAGSIKLYGDYLWGPLPGVPAAEDMRRATLAGVETVEHRDGGTPEIFKLMAEHHVALWPTLTAGDPTSQYGGWKKGVSFVMKGKVIYKQ